jgi:hypothetical protein
MVFQGNQIYKKGNLMLKPFKFIVLFLAVSFLCVPCAADNGSTDTKKIKTKGDYVDFDMYPAASIKNKGVLYMNGAELFAKQMVVYVVDKKNEAAGLWYIGGGKVSIYDSNKYAKAVVPAIKISSINPSWDRYIAAKEFFNVIDAGDKYIVCARTVSSEGYYTIPLRVSKKHMEAYGFRYIPLEDIIEICKRNSGMAKDMVGTEITPTQAELEKMRKEENPSAIVSEQGEEIISVGQDGLREPFKHKIYLLIKRPSLSAAFVEIKEPAVNQKKVLFKKNHWYELEVSVNLPYVSSDTQTDGVYRGGPYRGFWQAPYDKNGFPYLITEMVEDSWEKLAGEYFSEK